MPRRASAVPPPPPLAHADTPQLVVALDGPASSGKSTVGARAAAELGYRFVDTGLLYRGVTWLARDVGLPLDDGDAIAAIVPRVELRTDANGRYEHVVVDGRDVTDEVLGAEVDRIVSAVARQPQVRGALFGRQRRLADGGGIVVAGRDIGTVVLPDADVKVFLDATPEERARRRAEQRGLDPAGEEAAAILADLRVRDETDRRRETAPLRAAHDALVIHTDGNTLDDTVGVVVAAVRAAQARHAPPIDAIEEPEAPEASTPAEDAAPTENAEAALAAAERAAEADAAEALAIPVEAEPTAVPILPEREPTPVMADAGADAPRPIGRRTTSRPDDARPLADHITPFIEATDWFGRTMMACLTRVRIEGLDEPLDIAGPLIVTANHSSNADAVLLACWLTPALGRRIHWLGKQEALDWPVLGRAIAANGVFGIRRGAADLEAFRAAKRVLDDGHVLGVFPEGTRSPDGTIQEAKEGAAILALRTGAPILPVGISGTDRFWPRGRGLRVGGAVRMRVGRPFTLPEVRGGDRRARQQAATRTMMTRIAELVAPRQRGAYADDVDRMRGE